MSRFKEIEESKPYVKEILEQREKDKWAIIKDTYALSPIRGGDGRVLVEEDDYSSTRDCSKCKGTGHLNIPCEECKGTGTYRGKKESEDYCTTCHILKDKTQSSSAGAWINLNGKQPCDLCNGLGSSSIVIPDEAKNKTTTGTVRAISAVGINEVKVGEKVVYTNYAGSEFKYAGVDLRIIIEKDLLCKLKKLKTDSPDVSVKIEQYADLKEAGLPDV